MGCSNSRLINDVIIKETNDSYLNYKERHTSFSVLCSKYNSEIVNKLKTQDLYDLSNFNSDLETLTEIKAFGVLSREDLKSCLLEMMAQNTITDYFSYKEYDLVNILERLSEQILKKSKSETKQNLTVVIENVLRFINFKQTGIIFNMCENFELECWEALFNVFNFNESFKIEAINIEYSKELISNSVFNLKFRNFIEVSSTLKTLYINFTFDISNYESHLNFLLSSICNSKTLKILIIRTDKETPLTLSSEKIILQILKLDFLIAFAIKNFLMTNSFLDSFNLFIPKLKVLKGLVIDLKISNIERFDALIKQIGLNSSLLVFILTNQKISLEKLEGYKKHLELNKNLIFYDYLENFEF